MEQIYGLYARLALAPAFIGAVDTGAIIFPTFVAMDQPQPNNPLHGKTLEAILTHLVNEYGWDRLGEEIRINCFNNDPSIKSSLKFLRKTPWARAKVEAFYLDCMG